LEEFYRTECSETVRVGRVRVFEELPTVFNCSVLTFWSAIKFHREYRTRVRYNTTKWRYHLQDMVSDIRYQTVLSLCAVASLAVFCSVKGCSISSEDSGSYEIILVFIFSKTSKISKIIDLPKPKARSEKSIVVASD
jgi:hypothetical protein